MEEWRLNVCKISEIHYDIKSWLIFGIVLYVWCCYKQSPNGSEFFQGIMLSSINQVLIQHTWKKCEINSPRVFFFLSISNWWFCCSRTSKEWLKFVHAQYRSVFHCCCYHFVKSLMSTTLLLRSRNEIFQI